MIKQANNTQQHYAELGKMLTTIYETGYLDKKQSYKQSFIKGLVGGIGGVLGATVVVVLLLWVLSLFRNIDPLKPFIEKTTETIQQR